LFHGPLLPPLDSATAVITPAATTAPAAVQNHQRV
jgi:hypothetical protein